MVKFFLTFKAMNLQIFGYSFDMALWQYLAVFILIMCNP